MNLQNDKPQQERAYLEMLRPVVERLSKKDPARTALLCGGRTVPTGREEKSAVALFTLGREVTVCLDSGDIEPQLENWHSLVLLHYLDNADGTLPAGKWISFEDMKDGLIRGTKFAQSSSAWLQRFLAGKQLEAVARACEALGGVKVQGKGDVCLRVPFLPHFPVLLSFWEADEDFPATGKMLIDSTADHYLSIEDAVTVGEIVQNALASAYQAY